MVTLHPAWDQKVSFPSWILAITVIRNIGCNSVGAETYGFSQTPGTMNR